jgi:hypothetical protein
MLEERCARAGNERGVYCGLSVGCGKTREGARVNTCTIYRENVSMAARMEGNYSMGLRGLERWSA